MDGQMNGRMDEDVHNIPIASLKKSMGIFIGQWIFFFFFFFRF